MKVKKESEKVGLKLNIRKMKIMASGPITSWEIDGESVKTVTDFIFWGSKITADSDCSHETKRCLVLGRKVLTKLGSIEGTSPQLLYKKVFSLKAKKTCIYGTSDFSFSSTKEVQLEDGIIIKCTVVWGGAILHHQIDYIEAMPQCRKRSYASLAESEGQTSSSSSVLSFLYSPTLTFIHDYQKNHSSDQTDLCWQHNISAFKYAVIAFLPRSKRLLISWLQSLSAAILEPPKIQSATVSPSICHEVMGPDAMILVF